MRKFGFTWHAVYANHLCTLFPFIALHNICMDTLSYAFRKFIGAVYLLSAELIMYTESPCIGIFRFIFNYTSSFSDSTCRCLRWCYSQTYIIFTFFFLLICAIFHSDGFSFPCKDLVKRTAYDSSTIWGEFFKSYINKPPGAECFIIYFN